VTKPDAKLELRPRQAAFVSAMLLGKNITEAAAAVGVRRQTASRWLTEPAVSRALDLGGDESIRSAARRSVAAMRGALLTLERIHNDLDMPPGVRVSAARGILAVGPQLWESLELADRVAVLEMRLLEGVR
jgi:transposase